MKLKKKALLASLVVALAGGFAASAKKLSDLKIYINPGHGGYTSNDRPIKIYPFEQNDTLGYWESKSNLYKGLHMYHILDSLGTKAYLSRTKNTEDDDRSLSGISAEANQLGVDLFFSIHSNAGEDVNTPLMLYRENTIGTPRYEDNVKLSKIVWQNMYSSKLPVWTRDKEYVCGDLTFYQNMWSGGLGVLRNLYVVGLLSEGSMHEHRPEAHRLMNDDYLWLEAWHFVHSIMEFYETEDRFVTGNVAGIVYDNHNLREMDMPVTFHNYGRDTFAPLNFATVELRDKSGNVVQKRTTDNMYNGVFVFRNVKPGDYTLYTVRDGYYAETKDVTVTADEVTYQDMPLTMRREFPLEITAYSPVSGTDDAVSCASTIDFTFNTDVDAESFEKAFTITPAVDGYFSYSETYHKVSFIPTLALELNTTYTVNISTDAKTPDGYYSSPNMKEPLQFSFTTRGRNRLELIDQFPADGGNIHYASPTFEFRFDNVLDYSDIYNQITVTDSKGNAVSVNKRSSKFNQLSNGYGNAVFAITSNLTVGEKYHVKLSGELRDRENLPLETDIEYDFTADDASAEADANSEVIEGIENGSVFAYNAEGTTGVSSTLPTAASSTTSKLFGKSSERFSYKFSENHGGTVVWNYTGTPIQFNTNDVIALYVNGDFNNHELWVGLSSGTNKKYTKLCDMNFLGWKYVSARLENLEEDFCPFILDDIKLVQTSSPITQNGAFFIDNISRVSADTNGVNDIASDSDNAVINATKGQINVHASASTLVQVYAPSGVLVAQATAAPDAHIAVVPGIYIVRAAGQVARLLVK
jgi:hypothetical protein